ncbi:MAG: hypothetical protein Q4D16_10555 [Eubacteriales bacterium]|nr:hypothetical protein [Eubacteriales bacterium]
MKEMLYNKSEAVAALNYVEGFNPLELARKILNEGQEEQLYLDVKYRKLWFRLIHPQGKIASYIVNFTENMALVEARIYLDRNDSPDNYIASSFSQKFRSTDPQFGDKFLETAQTAAIGRALADAGFGLQFADVGEENDPAQVDAGITVSQNYQEQNIQQYGVPWSDAQAAMPAQPLPPVQMDTGQSMMSQFYQQAQSAGNTIGQPNRMPPASNGQNIPSQIPTAANQMAANAAMSVDELVKTMSYEQATQVVIGGNGKFGKKTMGQVAIESPSSVNWFAYDYAGNNNMVPAAARIILEKAMPKAG